MDDNDFELSYPEGEEPVQRADRGLDIMSLTAAQWDLFMAGYEAGRASGFDSGYAACEEAYAERHRVALTVMRRAGRLDVPPGQMYEGL